MRLVVVRLPQQYPCPCGTSGLAHCLAEKLPRNILQLGPVVAVGGFPNCPVIRQNITHYRIVGNLALFLRKKSSWGKKKSTFAGKDCSPSPSPYHHLRLSFGTCNRYIRARWDAPLRRRSSDSLGGDRKRCAPHQRLSSDQQSGRIGSFREGAKWRDGSRINPGCPMRGLAGLSQGRECELSMAWFALTPPLAKARLVVLYTGRQLTTSVCCQTVATDIAHNG